MHAKFLVALIASLVAVSGATHAAGSKVYIDGRTADDPEAFPFSGAVLAGDTLYLSGTIGLLPDRKVPDEAAEEARLVMDDVKRTLEKAGFTTADLVSVQVFCSDVAHFDAFNKVYRTYFDGHFPARAFIGSGKLLFDARFEVQGVAVRAPKAADPR